MATQKSEQFTCDRCRATEQFPDEQAASRTWGRVGLASGSFNRLFKIRELMVVNRADHVPTTADLCPDCCGALFDWWRGGKS